MWDALPREIISKEVKRISFARRLSSSTASRSTIIPPVGSWASIPDNLQRDARRHAGSNDLAGARGRGGRERRLPPGGHDEV